MRKGSTGFISKGGVYKKSSMIPRSNGGLLVIVSSFLKLPDDCGDELRFESLREAKRFLKDLRWLTKEEIQERIDRTGVPF